MISKVLEAVTKADIDALQANQVAEGKSIDYKLALPGNSDGDKREFLADASSFANAGGGDLIFGVSETGGTPQAIPGVVTDDADADIGRLEGILRTGVSPRMSGVQLRAITGFPQGPVIVLRVPKGWAGPHMVTHGGSSRFYTRNSAGKHQMDVGEIRSAFAMSELMPERMRQFRADRLGKIIASETPVPLGVGAKIVVHMIPLIALAQAQAFSPSHLRRCQECFRPMSASGWNNRFNVDGLLTTTGADSKTEKHWNYTQVFRNGIVESVDGFVLSPRGDQKGIASVAYEEQLIEAVTRFLEGYIALGVVPPAAILISFINVKYYELFVGRTLAFSRFENTRIDRDHLLLPDVLADSWKCDVPRLLKPIFDAVWNAAGWERSFNYDSDGNWSNDRQ